MPLELYRNLKSRKNLYFLDFQGFLFEKSKAYGNFKIKFL